MQTTTNNNEQLNETRNKFNNKVSRLSILGVSRTVKWNSKRRYRTI